MSGFEGSRDFEVALHELLAALGDQRRRQEATLQLRLMLEAAKHGERAAGYDHLVSVPLRARLLTREEAEQVIARIGAEMRKAGRRPDERPGLGSLSSALGDAEIDLALPPLLEAIAENWKSATACDIDGVLRALELQLWRAYQQPSARVVEQLRTYPQLRRVLRRVVERHLDTADHLLAEDLPMLAEKVDGYVAVILAEPELRAIRRSTFAVRGDVHGTSLELLRAMVRAAGQPIARCVIAQEWTERGEGDHEASVVLSPDASLYLLETDSDEYGRVTGAVWTKLDEQQRADHLETIELLQRVSQVEERERRQLGRVPRSKHAAAARAVNGGCSAS